MVDPLRVTVILADSEEMERNRTSVSSLVIE